MSTHCWYCGLAPDDIDTDHQLPTSRGGDESPSNLVAACTACNGRKNTRTVKEFREHEEWRLCRTIRFYGEDHAEECKPVRKVRPRWRTPELNDEEVHVFVEEIREMVDSLGLLRTARSLGISSYIIRYWITADHPGKKRPYLMRGAILRLVSMDRSLRMDLYFGKLRVSARADNRGLISIKFDPPDEQLAPWEVSNFCAAITRLADAAFRRRSRFFKQGRDILPEIAHRFRAFLDLPKETIESLPIASVDTFSCCHEYPLTELARRHSPPRRTWNQRPTARH